MPIESIKGRGATRNSTPTRFNLKERLAEGDWLDTVEALDGVPKRRTTVTIEHPRTTMLGHLTGRLLLRREGYRVDTTKIVDAAVANGVIIEINASPWRAEMDWRFWRKAADRGLLTSINPDAHETAELGYVAAGVNVARKGWLTKEQVFNTRTLAEVKAYLAKRK